MRDRTKACTNHRSQMRNYGENAIELTDVRISVIMQFCNNNKKRQKEHG